MALRSRRLRAVTDQMQLVRDPLHGGRPTLAYTDAVAVLVAEGGIMSGAERCGRAGASSKEDT